MQKVKAKECFFECEKCFHADTKTGKCKHPLSAYTSKGTGKRHYKSSLEMRMDKSPSGCGMEAKFFREDKGE